MNPNMVYLDTPRPQQAPQKPQLHGALKYQDPQVAAAFDAKRVEDPKRVIAKRAIQDMLSDLPARTKVLDAGCGTGLMFQFFASKAFIVLGVDLSVEMLKQAAKKLQAFAAVGIDVKNFELAEGNVCALPIADKEADVSVMSDLTRWLSPEECQQAMRELQRVTKRRIIWTARVANHRDARTIELFEAVLDGWKITRNEAGIDTDYRILMAEPA